MRFGFIISLIFAILVALFSIQNAEVISVNFFSAQLNISLALVIFVSSIFGAIIVTLFGLQKEFTLSRGNKQLAKKAKGFQNDIETSKNENVTLTIENETFKNKIETLESANKVFSDEINELNIEIKRLNALCISEASEASPLL